MHECLLISLLKIKNNNGGSIPKLATFFVYEILKVTKAFQKEQDIFILNFGQIVYIKNIMKVI